MSRSVLSQQGLARPARLALVSPVNAPVRSYEMNAEFGSEPVQETA
ncbi:MAG: hypothetical protein RDA78_16020 [Roseibium sp.]